MVANKGKISASAYEIVGTEGEERGLGKWDSVIVGGRIGGCLDCLKLKSKSARNERIL